MYAGLRVLSTPSDIMCGIAGYIGGNQQEGVQFVKRADKLLVHRGPDDNGIYTDEHVAMLHRRLSIIELSPLGHQPMESSCGRYVMVFNGEIYNHQELRTRFLPNHPFRGHSDTETIIELFSIMQERMLAEMVGMWAILIWDKQTKKAFVSRDRYGQKPVYVRHTNQGWYIASEVKPLLREGEACSPDMTAVVEYMAMGNYGHLGAHTFFAHVQHFPQGSYAWVAPGDAQLKPTTYWQLPDIKEKDKRPFDEIAKKELHNRIVEGVLSQTLADVPIGITLSGGIDSSIVAGVLAKYSDKDVHVFTAQTSGSKYDESQYVDAVIKMNPKGHFILHRQELGQLAIRNELAHYIRVQEEPFGDPSIMAHGFLMGMAAEAGIKVILNGQGADELFFGYNNMAQAILLQQLRALKISKFRDNLDKMKLGRTYMLRTLLKAFAPGVETRMRNKARVQRRAVLANGLASMANDSLIGHYDYSKPYDVWRESLYAVALPHLVQYDDRNGMSRSIEGRMPFLDHRIAEYVATIQPDDFLKHGKRKYLLREACRQYLPDEVYNRTDKIGFYTPLTDALYRDAQWVADYLTKNKLYQPTVTQTLLQRLQQKTLDTPASLQIWRCLSVQVWMEELGVQLPA